MDASRPSDGHRSGAPARRCATAWSTRPAGGAGITPEAGLRFGGSYTVGPYLNDEFTSAQLAGQDWKSYKQRVTAADMSYSIGYLVLNAEAAQGRFEVPNNSKTVDGYA